MYGLGCAGEAFERRSAWEGREAAPSHWHAPLVLLHGNGSMSQASTALGRLAAWIAGDDWSG